jgi:hypothetical protein
MIGVKTVPKESVIWLHSEYTKNNWGLIASEMSEGVSGWKIIMGR